MNTALAIYEGYWKSGEATLSDETEDVAWIEKNKLREFLSEKIRNTYLTAHIREALGIEHPVPDSHS